MIILSAAICLRLNQASRWSDSVKRLTLSLDLFMCLGARACSTDVQEVAEESNDHCLGRRGALTCADG